MNPNEISEKYEKPRMQILELKTEIRENNKTNGVGHSSCRCNRHVSVNWQVARLVKLSSTSPLSQTSPSSSPIQPT